MNVSPLIWLVVECEGLLLDPIMLRNHVVFPLKLSLTFTFACAVPFPLSIRTTGLIPTPNPTGGAEVESVTFAANPFRLVTLTVENPMEPAVIVRFDGEALIGQSGVEVRVRLAEMDTGNSRTRPEREREVEGRL